MIEFEGEPALRAEAAVDLVRAEATAWSGRRPRSFNARQALECLEFECLLVAVAAGNMAAGVALTDEDRARLGVACGRVQVIVDEAVG